MSSKKALLYLAIAFAISCCACLGYVTVRYRALGFNEVDFSYYYQFAANLAHPDLSKSITWPPHGINFLGLIGTEAQHGYHSSVHFEPAKYVYAGLLAMWPSPVILFLLIYAAFASPALYLVFCSRRSPHLPTAAVLASAYLLIPSAPLLVAYDLRPYVLIGPLFCLPMLTLYLRRPSAEVLLTFVMQFLAREEMLIFAAVTIAYAIVMQRTLLLLIVLIMVYIGYAWLLTLFLSASGLTPIEEVTSIPHVGLSPLQVALIGVGLMLVLYGVAKLLPRIPWASIVPWSVVVPLGIGFRGVFRNAESVFDLPWMLLSDRASLFIICVWLLLVIVALRARSGRQKYVSLIGVVLCLSGMLFYPMTIGARLVEYVGQASVTELVWREKAQTDRIATAILCDRYSFQAFCDYENIDVMGRLTPHVPEQDRGQASLLRWVLANRTDNFVLTTRSFELAKKVAAAELAGYAVTSSNEFYVAGRKQ